MKIILLILAAVPMFGISQANETGISFEKNRTWEQIKRKSYDRHVNIFVNLISTNCRSCTVMDRVYADNGVGTFFNTNFVSTTINIDSLSKDTGNNLLQIKSFIKQDHIKDYDYPGYLFFTSEGLLIYKDHGVKTSVELIKSADSSLIEKTQIYVLFRKWQLGTLPDHLKPYVAFKLHSDQYQEDSLARLIAYDYLHSDIVRITDSQLYSAENLFFIGSFYQLLSTKDKIFQWIYQNQDSLNVIMRRHNEQRISSSLIVKKIVFKDYLQARMAVAGKGDINWPKSLNAVAKIFGNVYSDRDILTFKFNWYLDQKIWRKLIRITIEYEEKYPNVLGPNNVTKVMIHCDNKKILNKAILWDKSSISDLDSRTHVGFTDYTNLALLLYKAGKKQDAIDYIEKYIKIMNDDPKNANFVLHGDSFIHKQEILKRMKDGKKIGDFPAQWFF